jgi:hypothetical protein
MISDWSHEVVLAATILSWFIIGTGLAQTTIYGAAVAALWRRRAADRAAGAGL